MCLTHQGPKNFSTILNQQSEDHQTLYQTKFQVFSLNLILEAVYEYDRGKSHPYGLCFFFTDFGN